MAKTVKQTVVRVRQGSARTFRSDVLLLGFFKNTRQVPPEYRVADEVCGGGIAGLLKLGDFTGGLGETAVVYAPRTAPCPRVMLIGLGEKAKWNAEAIRQAVGTAIRVIDKMAGTTAGLILPDEAMDGPVDPGRIGQAVGEGAVVGRYDFEDYLSGSANGKKASPRMQLTLLVDRARSIRPLAEGIRVGTIFAEGQNLARMVANQPANEINPPALAEQAGKIARRYGLRCRVFNEKDLARMKMNSILAVGNSSAAKPRLIVLEYDGRKGRGRTGGPDLVVVGKAVTFDSGGIDLKPPQKMELMKFDKSGGCAVLGILAAAARLKLPRRIVGLIPSAENMLSGTCWRPGDIVTTYSGKTVEVLSTDAEGRMLLCDALSYATRLQPRAMVDLATLTGACAVALGEGYAGLFGNDEPTIARLKAAGEASGERVWHLPSGPEYLDPMKSKVADLKNVGMREGGACSAAAFLGEFVKGIPWAHVDIACVAKPDTDKPWRNSGATGFGVRLVLEYLRTPDAPSRRGR